jgi:TadE-like protein
MIMSLKSRLKQLRRSEEGNATVEFVILFPLMLMILAFGVDLAFVNLRHAWLERAVDQTVRDIRLSTGTAPQHDEIKDLICARAGFIQNCEDNLRLEMIQLDPRNWTGIPADADCTDKNEEVSPVREFVYGQDNELMILRACARNDPIFPDVAVGLGKNLADDPDGERQYSLVSITAFVQEPQ